MDEVARNIEQIGAMCACDVHEAHPSSECVPYGMAEAEIVYGDVRAILRALDLGEHARPYSAHAVIHREVLPAISALRAYEQAAAHTSCATQDLNPPAPYSPAPPVNHNCLKNSSFTDELGTFCTECGRHILLAEFA